ncbi:sensor histidine kinase [Pseudooceanicola algae]|uniref:C4-dicarboxylate transport sensor protein DctB n=1 Tax=Pseudooceanicola algae TaxID=1537215 RepID=A0A418SF04_9RHOB|nr:ATP-binding protein [Pseudooceanicola algae]QPM89336.1 Adaptive-response sensory-kinase SasA [Pseudooceanicola algae]
MWRRARAMLALLLAVAVISLAVFHAGYRQSLNALAQRGESDLSLAADRLTGQLQRYQDLAVLFAQHPTLRSVSAGAFPGPAADLMLRLADRTGVLNMAYLDDKGQVLAEARPGAVPETTYVAEAIARAQEGALGTGHGLAPGSALRSYVFAAPSFAPGGGVMGILMVSVNVELLEAEWRGDRPAVLFTDETGQVFITNRSELLGWQRGPGLRGLSPRDAPAAEVAARFIGGRELWHIDWSPYLPRRVLYLERDLPKVGMLAVALVDAAPSRRIALLQAAVVGLVLLVFGVALLSARERRRVLAEANAGLETRVADRTAALSGANTRLRREVQEREEAEAALKRAQSELVQAGKLSALGQMSAGLGHELNQPLMAIGQFAENGALFLERGQPDKAAENLIRIAGLAGRLGRIIRNLRAFARQESAPVRRIDLVQVISTALEMTEARLAGDGITLHWTPPSDPVWAMGGEVRLAQVLVNLITNAADAMTDSPRKRLDITLTGGAAPEIRLRDTGTGISDPDKIFDPFFSTKEVGASEGMGLGLSISYGMVQSQGGTIRGDNHPEGGAEFLVQLPVATEQV